MKQDSNEMQFYNLLKDMVGRTFCQLRNILIIPDRDGTQTITISIKQQKERNKPQLRAIHQQFDHQEKSELEIRQIQETIVGRKHANKKSSFKDLKKTKRIRKKGIKPRSKQFAENQGKPYPPLNAFMIFLQARKYDIMKNNPQLPPTEVTRHASAMWKEFTTDQKKKYYVQYQKNHEKYVEDLKIYQQNKISREVKNIEVRSNQEIINKKIVDLSLHEGSNQHQPRQGIERISVRQEQIHYYENLEYKIQLQLEQMDLDSQMDGSNPSNSSQYQQK